MMVALFLAGLPGHHAETESWMRRQNISLRGAESILPPCTMAQELLSPLALQLQLGWEEKNWQVLLQERAEPWPVFMLFLLPH